MVLISLFVILIPVIHDLMAGNLGHWTFLIPPAQDSVLAAQIGGK